MIENRLLTCLINRGYEQLHINSQNITITYLKQDNEVYIVSLIHIVEGEYVAEEQYQGLLDQIRQLFFSMEFTQIHLLNLICTHHPSSVKQLTNATDVNWIIDLNQKRLVIYENQPAEFFHLREVLEHAIMEEPQERDRRGIQLGGYRIFTLFNSILVMINVILFLMINFTHWFGGTQEIVMQGALSWRSIRFNKEYYRLITSIFMHADLSHLINNMLVLLFVGDNLERAAGKVRYLFIYFGAGILAGISSIGYNMMMNTRAVSIGASGAIFGVVGAMVYILIVNKGKLEDISTRQIALFALFSLYGGITNARVDNIAHIGGFIAGFLLALLLYRKPYKKKHSESRDSNAM